MMNKILSRKTDTVFVLIIFCVFAMSVLVVLMLGASTYQNMTEISRDGHDERTVLSYVWSKVKNNDNVGSIYVGDFHGKPALCIVETIGQTDYLTVVYHYDGWVYELFSETELFFYPEDGVRLIKIDELLFEEIENGMIQVSSASINLIISPRGSMEIGRNIG